MTHDIIKNNHRYQIRVLDIDGNIEAVYDDVVSIFYRKQVNNVGICIIAVPEGHDLLNYAMKDQLIQVMISYTRLPVLAEHFGQIWSADYYGLFRDRQIATDANGNVYHILYFPSLLEVLARYVSAIPAATGGKSQWTGARLSVICNDVVRWNCTAEATVANDRLRDATVIRDLHDNGAIPGTPEVNYSVAPGRNILEFLQELAPICGFDIDVIYSHPTVPGGISVQQFLGQLGTDRSTSVMFDLALDNTAQSSLSFDGLRERTVAIVGGQGEESARTFSIRTGANYAADNDYEVYVDARSNPDDELDDIGDARLAELTARIQMLNAVTSSDGWVYRRDFSHGDLVTVRFAGFSQVKKIGTTEVQFDQDQTFHIRMEMIEPHA